MQQVVTWRRFGYKDNNSLILYTHTHHSQRGVKNERLMVTIVREHNVQFAWVATRFRYVFTAKRSSGLAAENLVWRKLASC